MNRVMILILLVCVCIADTLNATSSTEENQVVQCHSVTNSGTRCKRRARPNTRYCKQHSSSVAPKKEFKRCRSITDDGGQCVEVPKAMSRYCLKHQ